jgi:glycosyltransferase involved in cell wall biosynthesis
LLAGEINTMKICIVGPAYPYKGGIASFNERMAKELQEMGHEVDIYTFTLQYPSFLFPGKSQYSNDSPPKSLKIVRAINSVNPLNWLLLGRRIKKAKYDLIISKFWLPLLGPSLGSIIRLGKSKDTKAIGNIDNIIPHEKRPGDKIFAQYFTDAMDAFLVMSHKVEHDMERFIKQQPINYAPHPIYDNYGAIISREAACKYLGLDPNMKYVLFFGFVRAYKGLDLLLKSFKIALEKDTSLRLIIAGEYYADKEKYAQLILSLGIEDYIIEHSDFIPNDEVKYFFCASDIVAQTYLSATQSGISQLAIHFEKPILSTNVGGLPETTIHLETGYLVNVNKDEIADAMYHFFNEQDADAFRKGILKLKADFSWERFTKALLDLYNKISSND